MLRALSRRSRWWVALVQVVLLLLTFAIPAAAADPAPAPNLELILLLKSYGIVKGDPSGNLLLDKPISRAEMITIMVRSLGAETESSLYKDFPAFPDAQGHWAAGAINYAAVKRLVKGDDNGKVRPNDPISYAEALTLVLRVVKLEPTTGSWPMNVLLKAAELGLVPEGVNYGNINDPAIRGLIFGSLATAVTTVKTEDGATYLQKYVDPRPPVVTLAPPAATTSNPTVRVSGTAKEAASVKVNGVAASLVGDIFTADVTLDYGTNKITAVATDLAGNTATAEVSVTRSHPITTLDVTGPDKVRPNGTAQYVISAKNSAGTVMPLDGVEVKIEGNIGTFNLTTGIFTAASTPAKGKITLTAGTVTKSITVEVMGQNTSVARLSVRTVNDGQAVSYTKPMTVAVEVQDANGMFLDTDYGRPVTLTAAGLSGLSVTPQVAYTEAGVATFTVRTGMMGTTTLTATSDGILTDASTAVFGSSMRVRLTAEPSTLVIGSANPIATIKATLVDESGNPVMNNTGSDIGIQLSFTGGNGSIVDSFVRITPGTNSSTYVGDNGSYSAGTVASTVQVKGTLITNHTFTVDSASVTTVVPTIGTGSFWDLLGSTALTPSVPSNFTIRLSDSSGGTIPGSYAFKLGLSTSNSDAKVNGIPDGVELYIGTTRITNADTVLRTINGVASMRIQYDRPGQVGLTITPVAATASALAHDGTLGNAAASGVPSRTINMNLTGTATAVALVVDSEGLGNGQDVGAASIRSTRGFILRAMLTDGTSWIPGTIGDITLEREAEVAPATYSTNLPLLLGVGAADGKASFTVGVNGTAGTDRFRVRAVIPRTSGGPLTVYSNWVTLYAQDAVPAQTSILAVRGVNNGIPGAINYLAPDDTDLEFELNRDAAQPWAVVKVYREGVASPIYTSEPIAMTAVAPRVRVPKASVPSGVFRYQVSIQNGYGESVKSLVSASVTNAKYVTNVTLSGAMLQRSTNTLVISGSGFNTNDRVNPALIAITDGGNTVNLALTQATVTAYGQITINLANMNATDLANLKDTSMFSGNDVRLTTAAGWYTRANGEIAEANTTGVAVSPMAHIDHLEYDAANSRLYLVGAGFTTVNMDFTKLKLRLAGNPAGTEISLSSSGASRIDDTRYSVTLSSDAVTKLSTNAGYTLTGLAGWAYSGAYTMPERTGIEVHGQVVLSGVSYDPNGGTMGTITITGSGFTAGSVSVGLLSVTDLSTGQTAPLAGDWEVASDSTIVITLTSNPLTDTVKFLGDDVYLIGGAGWFTNSAGRSSAAIPSRTLLFPPLVTP